MASNAVKGCGCLLAGLALLVVIGALLPSSNRAPIEGLDPDPPERVLQAQESVAKAQKAGIIVRYTCTGNDAYVTDRAWHAFDVDAKRGMTVALAIVCHAQKSGRRMTIYSQQTGKKLASFGALGFSVE